jgi:hypothetical protein
MQCSCYAKWPSQKVSAVAFAAGQEDVVKGVYVSYASFEGMQDSG